MTALRRRENGRWIDKSEHRDPAAGRAVYPLAEHPRRRKREDLTGLILQTPHEKILLFILPILIIVTAAFVVFGTLQVRSKNKN